MFVKLKDKEGEDTWVNPDNVIRVSRSIPRQGRVMCTLAFTSGYGAQFTGSAEDTVRVLNSGLTS